MVAAVAYGVEAGAPAGSQGGLVGSAAEMIAGLNTASQKLDEARSKATAAVQDVAEARRLVAGVLEGAEPGPLVGVIEAYRQALTQAAQVAEPASQHIQETIARIQSLGN